MVVLRSRKKGRELSKYPQIPYRSYCEHSEHYTCTTRNQDLYLTKGFVLWVVLFNMTGLTKAQKVNHIYLCIRQNEENYMSKKILSVIIRETHMFSYLLWARFIISCYKSGKHYLKQSIESGKLIPKFI